MNILLTLTDHIGIGYYNVEFPLLFYYEIKTIFHWNICSRGQIIKFYYAIMFLYFNNFALPCFVFQKK